MATIKNLKRMCKSFNDNCDGCPLHDKIDNVCFMLTLERLPNNADEIVDKWVSEHPVKTYVSNFYEKFPGAERTESGIPNICIERIYNVARIDEYCCKTKCIECWNQEMKD